MTVVASDLILALDKCHSYAASEADWRGVCARAYYSIHADGDMFHNSLPEMGRLLPKPPGTPNGRHEQLIERLQNPSLKTQKKKGLAEKSVQVGMLMKSLHLVRIKSDYKRGESVDAAAAAQSVANAKKVYDLLHGPVSTPPAASAGQPAVPNSVTTTASSAQPAQSSTVTNAQNTGGRPTLTRIK